MSSVWNYYTRNKQKPGEAVCCKCKKLLKCVGSSTSSLRSHLRKIHAVNLEASNANPSESSDNEVSTSKKPRLNYSIDKYTTKSKNNLAEILSRCVAEDGWSVKSIKNSTALNTYLKLKSLKMPSSEATIWNLIDDFYNEKKRKPFLN